MTPSDAELNIMRHTLGAESRSPGYRNYYCASEGDEVLEAMVAKGFMDRLHTINGGRDRYYSVPPQWRKVMGITVKR